MPPSLNLTQPLCLESPYIRINGQPEIYGLGIRLGIYLAWMSSIISIMFNLECAEGISAAYTIFPAAFAVNMVFGFYGYGLDRISPGSKDDHRPYPAELAIINYLLIVGWLCVQTQPLRQSVLRPLRLWYVYLKMLLYIVIFCGTVGFWEEVRTKPKHFRSQLLVDYTKQTDTPPECIAEPFVIPLSFLSVYWMSFIFQNSCVALVMFMWIRSTTTEGKHIIEAIRPGTIPDKEELIDHANATCTDLLSRAVYKAYQVTISSHWTVQVEDITYKSMTLRVIPDHPNPDDQYCTKRYTIRLSPVPTYELPFLLKNRGAHVTPCTCFVCIGLEPFLTNLITRPQRVATYSLGLAVAWSLPLAICGIVAVERTIQLNQVDNVNTVDTSSVGQLLSLLFGVGCLIRTVTQLRAFFARVNAAMRDEEAARVVDGSTPLLTSQVA